mmetsp:Transcript_11634/g.26907  ORF Transcript_11634/g.26907 Transcript_11634/m.26907 type:complete len:120 (-) Transcript_11634:570-929(-)
MEKYINGSPTRGFKTDRQTLGMCTVLTRHSRSTSQSWVKVDWKEERQRKQCGCGRSEFANNQKNEGNQKNQELRRQSLHQEIVSGLTTMCRYDADSSQGTGGQCFRCRCLVLLWRKVAS